MGSVLRLWAIGLGSILAAVLSVGGTSPARAALEVVVTSAAGGGGECPHETNCTLAAAIALVNADDSGDPYTLGFAQDIFDPSAFATIALEEPLPALTRDDVTIDAAGAGVVLDGSALAEVRDGLVLMGARDVVRGLSINGFQGVCIVLAGDQSVASGNRIGGCGVGVYANAGRTLVRGNVIGFRPDSDGPSGLAFGIVVNAADVELGDPDAGPATANIIGNANTAIRVGDVPGPAFSGVVVAGNIIGKSPAGTAAPVGTGIELRAPAEGVHVLSNLVANTTGNAVVVAPDTGGESSTGNTIQDNRFEAIGGLSIDLGANGLRDLNDAGDGDEGPNSMLNHPSIATAVQSRIEGNACPGCIVQLYIASHQPGGATDFATVPLPGGTLRAGATGSFSLDAPSIAPGDWVTAIAIDAAGNTSEFAPASRVGVGIVQCGDVALGPGWNLTGYFGQASLPLGTVFPPGSNPDGDVSAIYRLVDGSESYLAWFANGGAGRTLNTLEVGEAFWMHAVQPVVLGGGFSLTVPLPVTLHAGWNEFVYIGASSDIRDALSSIVGKYSAVYRWSNATGRWLAYYPDLPAWVQGFTQLQSCGAYSLYATEDVTLTPLQP